MWLRFELIYCFGGNGGKQPSECGNLILFFVVVNFYVMENWNEKKHQQQTIFH